MGFVERLLQESEQIFFAGKDLIMYGVFKNSFGHFYKGVELLKLAAINSHEEAYEWLFGKRSSDRKYIYPGKQDIQSILSEQCSQAHLDTVRAVIRGEFGTLPASRTYLSL